MSSGDGRFPRAGRPMAAAPNSWMSRFPRPAAQAHPLGQEPGQGARKGDPVHRLGFQYGTGNEVSMKSNPRSTFTLERDHGGDLEAEAERRAQTLKYSKRLKEQMQEQLERKTQERTERRTGPVSDFNPFGRDQPLRDGSGNVVRRKTTLWKEMASDIVAKGAERDGLAFQLGCHGGGGGAPHRDKHGNVVGIRPRQILPVPSRSEGEGYDPWGKPGCGAPKRSKNGQITAARLEALSRETDSARTILRRSQEKQRYLQHLRQEMQPKYDAEVARHASGGIDLASWIRSGQVGQPPMDPASGEFRGASRAVSDVVREKLALRRPAGKDSEHYYQDLQQQAEERHRNKVLEREEDRRLTQQHIDATDKIWNVERGVQFNARQPQEMDRKLEEERAAYHSELHQQATSKQLRTQMERQQVLEKEREHVDAFNSQWGRPGGGAPRQDAQHRQTYLMPPFAVSRRRS